MVVEKIGNLYGLLMVEEEDKNRWQDESKNRDEQIDHLQKKLTYMQTALATEEDAKRRMLLRYIHMVKEHALTTSSTSLSSSLSNAGGEVNLPESNITDEEVHALAALLRNNTTITTLNLRSNNITDDGARALAAVLAGKSSLAHVDLKGNKISKGAIRIIAEALERAERVKHVYVHAGGKIEALGTNPLWAQSRFKDTRGGGGADDSFSRSIGDVEPRIMATVETVCVVDVRDNSTEGLKHEYQLRVFQDGGPLPTTDGKKPPSFQPTDMLDVNPPPPAVHLVTSKSDSLFTPSPGGDPKASTPSTQLRKTMSDIPVEEDKKKQKLKLHELKALALKEIGWQGRLGTLDSSSNTITNTNTNTPSDQGFTNKLKKKIQRVDLLPLIDGTEAGDGETGGRSSSRGRSGGRPGTQGGHADTEKELDTGYHSDASAGKLKVKKKKKKDNSVEKKTLENSPFASSIVEKKTLENSPFASSILKITDGK